MSYIFDEHNPPVSNIRWGRTLPGALKQTLTFACTPSDVRHWLHEQSNLLRQDRDAVERLEEIGLTGAIDAGTTSSTSNHVAFAAAAAAATNNAPNHGGGGRGGGGGGGGGGGRQRRPRSGIDRALAQME
jgi:hypothetical protein